MNLFWLLLLAHLVGDFALQTDRVFYYKTKKHWGLWIHVGICTVCNFIFTLPYLVFPAYWLILIGLTLSHFIYDQAKIKLTDSGVDDNAPIFLLDQVLHIATIFVATLIFHTIYPDPALPKWGIWDNLELVKLLSGFVLIIFAIAPLNYFLINDYYAYLKKLKRPHWQFPGGAQRKWGYLERGLIAFGIIYNGFWLVLIPAALLLRFIFDKQRHWGDYGLSVAFTILIALGLQQIIA